MGQRKRHKIGLLTNYFFTLAAIAGKPAFLRGSPPNKLPFGAFFGIMTD
jgi:hypothetical protein